LNTPTHRLIIALPGRLLAETLAQFVSDKGDDIMVCGTAADNKELFELLKVCAATVLLYDPHLRGPGAEVVCCRLKHEFPNLKTILMKNENANGRFTEARKFNPAAFIGSDAMPYELIDLIKQVDTEHIKARKKKRTVTELHQATLEIKEPKSEQEPISTREKDIVSLVVRGHSARQIAFVLDIAVNTARNHIQNILNKLGLSNKIQLIAWHLSKNE